MRIFLLGWDHTREDHIEVAIELQNRSHEIIYWSTTSENSKIDRLKFPNTILHSHFNASQGIAPPNIDISKFIPISKELIERFQKTESLVLSMMNKRFDWMCTDERKNLYFKILEYWNGILKKYNPDLIIFSAIPHTVYDYIVYELAKDIGIKTIMFDSTLISDRYIVLEDFRKGSRLLARELENNSFKKYSLNDLSHDVREYYNKQTNQFYDSTPDYTKEDKKNNTTQKIFLKKLKVIIDSIKNGSIIWRFFNYIFKSFGDNIKKEYLSIQVDPDFSKKFIYLPLNYQPECTTSPQGDIFVNQILMIKIISYSIPDDWVIYIKEHPSQWFPRGLNFFSSRFKGYYEEISKFKNTYIIPIKTNTYELINKSQAVATVTGTAGWEAVLRSKPAIIFGYPWYQNCPIILRVQDVESCKKAIQRIISGNIDNKDKVFNFLKALDNTSIKMYISSYIEKQSMLSKIENAKNILKAILNEIY